MNCVTIIGTVAASPTYHCTSGARDLCRIQLLTYDDLGRATLHHCLAWGPAALNLHQHLAVGDALLLRGKLCYRKLRLSGVSRPFVKIVAFSYLGEISAPLRKLPDVPEHA